jgi:hypothetical protein
MLKFSHTQKNQTFFFLKGNKESDEIFRNIYHLSKWNPQKSINYATNMCPSDQVGPEGFLILNNMRDRKMPRITKQLFSQVKEFHRGPLSKV